MVLDVIAAAFGSENLYPLAERQKDVAVLTSHRIMTVESLHLLNKDEIEALLLPTVIIKYLLRLKKSPKL